MHPLLHLLSMVFVSGSGGSSSKGRRKNASAPSKRGRTYYARPVYSDDEIQEEVAPKPPPVRRQSARSKAKSVARKRKSPVKTAAEMKQNEYWQYRERNPYCRPQDAALVGRPFWNRDQSLVYFDRIKAKKNLFVKTKSINIEHMEKDRAYFGEALDLCAQFNIVPIMTFNYDFDAELVAQFFATVWFGTEDNRTMIWMTHGRQLRATWGEFMDLLGYPDEGLEKPLGLRPHHEGGPANKDNLLPHMTIRGSKKELKPFFDIMHRIFRHTLFPRVGNLDMVHGHLVDMLCLCHSEKGTGAVLDVSHVMWKELVNAAYGDHVPIYAPFIFRLIVTTWTATFPEEQLETGPLISHETINLRQKELWAPTRHAPSVPLASEEDVEDTDYVPDPEHSSGWSGWAAKLKNKVKKLFCLQTDVQHKMYLAHVDAKKARQQRKAIMRKLDIPVESGSENVITPEDNWISSHTRWTDSDDSNTGASAPAPEHAEEESEDPEDSEESSDGESDAEASDESMGGD